MHPLFCYPLASSQQQTKGKGQKLPKQQGGQKIVKLATHMLPEMVRRDMQ